MKLLNILFMWQENSDEIQLGSGKSETELEDEDKLNLPVEPKEINRMKTNETKKEGEHYLQNITSTNKRVQFDHSPHDVFVQLDELKGAGDEREWKETARWIKYEEDVEEGADRWGRPHVASLSFHSLLNLKKCLETGVVLMDLEEKDLPGVACRVVEEVRWILQLDAYSVFTKTFLDIADGCWKPYSPWRPSADCERFVIKASSC